jgi:hypothetical protein
MPFAGPTDRRLTGRSGRAQHDLGHLLARDDRRGRVPHVAGEARGVTEDRRVDAATEVTRAVSA